MSQIVLYTCFSYKRNIRQHEWNHGKSIKSISTIRKNPKSHVLISHLKTLLSCIKTLEGSRRFQANVKCLGTVHDVFRDLVSPYFSAMFLCTSVMSVCFLHSGGPQPCQFPPAQLFYVNAFAYVFPSALFHLPTPGVQAAESGLTNYWKPFLFLPCYCNTVRPPLYFLCTFTMLS